ncbi:MAG TPA: CpsD/CapB family tyrosine-protein kinase [Blastocatellia bacterium]|nr:CpsD/CapB family tyrosine-protein kinase [Blastocatellia bacterium]
MGRIFDALQRDQQTQPNGRRDPLAEATRSPELAADQQVELPEMIGAPVTPHSNQGGVLSYLREDFLNGERPQRVPDDEAVFSQMDAVYPDARLTPGVSGDVVQAKSDGAQKLYQPGGQGKYRLPETIEPRVALSLNLDPARVHPRLIAVTEPHSIVSEQYRTLRTQIFHEAERRLTQVVVVTSAIAGEGKTSTSLNLSWTIANSKGRRVLLIDSDMRRPSVASYLGIAPAVGFCEVLAGDCELMAPVIRIYGRSLEPDLDEDYQLFVLPVKGEARNPTELLSGSSLPDVINEYRRYFDFIIIDSPPVTPFADARLLANQSDGALVVIRSGAAPYSTVERAIEALSPARMLGVVLNGAKEDEDDGYYYEYYYTEDKRSQRFPFGLRKIAARLGLFGRGASQQNSLTGGNPASSGKAGADEK